MAADPRRLVKKLWIPLNTLICTRGKEIAKKECLFAVTVRVTLHSCAVLTPPPKLLVTPWRL